MTLVLHNVIAIAMSLLVLAAPALCMCQDKAPVVEQTAHQCCSAQNQQPEDKHSDQHHGETCTHCGAQTVRLLVDQPVTPADLMPIALLPISLEPMLLERVEDAPAISPQHPDTPVLLHTCSLT